MLWLLVLVLVVYLAILIKWTPEVLRVFGRSPLLRTCGCVLFIASVFVALTAVGGGISVAAGIDKFPADWLIGTPFATYLIPGLILAAVVGGSAAVAAIATLRTLSTGTLMSILAGAIMLGWLAGERIVLPPAAFPTQFLWLEAIYVAAGLMMVGPALTARWLSRRSGSQHGRRVLNPR